MHHWSPGNNVTVANSTALPSLSLTTPLTVTWAFSGAMAHNNINNVGMNLFTLSTVWSKDGA